MFDLTLVGSIVLAMLILLLIIFIGVPLFLLILAGVFYVIAEISGYLETAWNNCFMSEEEI